MTVGAPDTKTAELQPESQTGGLVNSPSIAQVAPIFVLDSHEAWRPVPVEDSLERLGYVWEHGEGFVNKAGQKVDRLDFPQNLDPQRFSDLPLVGYHRTVEGAPLKWHQFWFWYIYNPKMYAGYGEHEGDWEMCQIGCDLTVFEHPILMTLSQHSGGEKREFWRVEADPPKANPHRAVIYIARDSHAAYFEPHRDVTDVADGHGKTLGQIEWREFGPWALWSGQWGNSANSPGPLATRRAWKAPHAWHGQARG